MRPSIPEGLHARYVHHRLPDWDNRIDYVNSPIPPALKGGTTVCYLEDDKNKTVAIGSARCSEDDNYVKAIGRDISLGRAIKNLALAQENSERDEVGNGHR